MDSVQIPWELANQYKDPVAAGQQGAAFGLDYGQKLATLNALRGVNLNDSGSIDNAIQGSIHAGALEQANALTGLAWTRAMRQGLPQFMNTLQTTLNGGGGPQGAPRAQADTSSAAPQPAGAGPDAGPAPAPKAAAGPDMGGEGQPAANLAGSRDVLMAAKQATDTLLNTPPEHRAEQFQQIKQAMVARGVPEAAIDAAGQDLSNEGLQKLGAYYQAHADHLTGLAQAGPQPAADQAGGAAPPPSAAAGAVAAPSAVAAAAVGAARPQPDTAAVAAPGPNAAPAPAPAQAPAGGLPTHPSAQWAQNLLSNPALLAQIAQYKAAGYDMSGLVDTAKAIAQPEIAKAAEEAHAAPIAAKTAAGKSDYDLIDTTIRGPDGTVVPVKMTLAQFKANQAKIPGLGIGLTAAEEAEQKAAGQGRGELKYAEPLAEAKSEGQGAGELKYAGQIAGAKAGATAAAEAPYKTVDVDETDENGEPTGRKITITAAQAANTAAHGGVVGRGWSDAEKQFHTNDATALSKTATDAGDPVKQQQLAQRAQASTNAIALANKYASGKFTPQLSEISQVLNGLGIDTKGVKDTATGTAMLQQALAQEGANAFANQKNLRTQREFSYITSTVGEMHDPADKLRYVAAATAAAINQQRAYNRFVSQYSDLAAQGKVPASQARMQEAWSKAHANDSIFADPSWQNVKLFGQPAVRVNSAPSRDGHTYGFFGYGTPLQQVFMVK